MSTAKAFKAAPKAIQLASVERAMRLSLDAVRKEQRVSEGPLERIHVWSAEAERDAFLRQALSNVYGAPEAYGLTQDASGRYRTAL